MKTETKLVVLLAGQIVNVGPWDVGLAQISLGPDLATGREQFAAVETNPLPAGAITEEREVWIDDNNIHYLSPPPPAPRSQPADVVLGRMTDAEVLALNAATHPAAVRARLTALSTGLISEADPRFPAMVAGLDALGIIAIARWPELLAS